jgi:hypothetical protein
LLGLDAPDQGANQGPSGRWAILVRDQFQHTKALVGGGISVSFFLKKKTIY